MSPNRPPLRPDNAVDPKTPTIVPIATLRIEMRSNFRLLKLSLLAAFATLFLFLVQSHPFAQTQSQWPAPTGHMNDFAGVISASEKERLEVILENLKLRSKVDFYVAIVEGTGTLDIFDYSRDLSRSWNLGSRNSTGKSLLLVVSVGSKSSFTQFSRLVQTDLPEGVLGEMTQRMRGFLASGQYAEAIDDGVRHFTTSLAQKLRFSIEDIDKPITAVARNNDTAATPNDTVVQISPAVLTDQPLTRPRTVSDRSVTTPAPATPEPSQASATPEPSPASATPEPSQAPATPEPSPAPPTPEPSISSSQKVETPESASVQTQTATQPSVSDKPVSLDNAPAQPESSPKPVARNSEKPAAARPGPKPVKKQTTPPRATAASNTKTPNPATKKQTVAPAVNDEDEEEEVELTLTKPLAQRAIILKEFLATHPNSKARPRAIELLISAHASLGDQSLRNGDNAAGVEQLMLAIEEADTTVTDKLFSGVIAQIPMNLYLRGERAAAFTAAQKVETKFGTDPKRLLALAGFYLSIERGDEIARLAEQAIKLAPEMAEAHSMLALGLHIGLRLEDAAVEYKRALELDPNLKGARISLADLYRGSGRVEDALALYQDQLKQDPKDKAARTGAVLSLLELGRKDEANSALDQALADDPRNLTLLSAVAYWYVAREDFEKASVFAQKAVAVEPRYTWAQIAWARTLIGLKRPLDAERSIRFALQYGKFPTLNYELANVLARMGLYEEAVDVLRESFTIKDAQIETRLAGRLPATNSSFTNLLAPERRASIYQPTAADTDANAKMLKDLLSFNRALTPPEGEKIDEAQAETAARAFAGGADDMRAFRQVYAASRLLRKNVGTKTALELVEDARKNADTAMDTPVATMATQADEYRDMRARAIASGSIPDIAEAPRNLVANIFRGRLDDLAGWALFNQEKYPEAIENLKRASTTLPSGTPAWRTALWHLGVALEQSGSNEEALNTYITSYKAGDPDPIRRSVIERLYRKINGSVNGLDEQIGAPATGTTPAGSQSVQEALTSKPAAVPAATNEQTAPVATPERTPTSETTATTEPKQESSVKKAADEAVKPEATPSPQPTPSTLADSQRVATTQPLSDADIRAASARARSTIKITGRVVDANKAGLGNVVVVLISPSGSVLAATTDSEGKYSFTVAASQKTYRVIPSRDGYTFSPIDRTLPALLDDQLEINFIGTTNP